MKFNVALVFVTELALTAESIGAVTSPELAGGAQFAKLSLAGPTPLLLTPLNQGRTIVPAEIPAAA